MSYDLCLHQLKRLYRLFNRVDTDQKRQRILQMIDEIRQHLTRLDHFHK